MSLARKGGGEKPLTFREKADSNLQPTKKPTNPEPKKPKSMEEEVNSLNGGVRKQVSTGEEKML